MVAMNFAAAIAAAALILSDASSRGEPDNGAKAAAHDDATLSLPVSSRPDQPITQAAWSPFCSNCEKEREKLSEALKSQIAEHDALKDAVAVFKESFGYIRIDWVKAALYNGGFYDKLAVRIDGYDLIVKSLEYNRLTIDAVKRFQCQFHEAAADGKCDKSQSTGWITFLESRSAICEQGAKAADQTAYQLAEWYALGRVYEQDLGFAYSLVDRYRANLKAQIAAEPDAVKKEYLLSLDSDAIKLKSFIDRLIHEKAKTERLTPAQLAALHGQDIVYDIKVMCPRGA